MIRSGQPKSPCPQERLKALCTQVCWGNSGREATQTFMVLWEQDSQWRRETNTTEWMGYFGPIQSTVVSTSECIKDVSIVLEVILPHREEWVSEDFRELSLPREAHSFQYIKDVLFIGKSETSISMVPDCAGGIILPPAESRGLLAK